jgi:DNA repair ATPase RecN
MTDNSNRLSRIEAIVESNSRTIQAMLEQNATDRLEHEERMKVAEERIARLEEVAGRLTNVEEGMARWLTAIDDTQPTILRLLNGIDKKVDILLESDREA